MSIKGQTERLTIRGDMEIMAIRRGLNILLDNPVPMHEQMAAIEVLKKVNKLIKNRA